MRPLGRRSLFALPLVAPVAVAVAVKTPTPPLIDSRPRESLTELATSLQEWKPAPPLDEAHWDKIAAEIARLEPSARDLAATLGIDVQRDGIVISAMVARA